jgi:GNAT superfamily N-acetyltransferase
MQQIKLGKNLTECLTDKVELALLAGTDIDEIVLAFKNIGWNKPKTIYKIYLDKQIQNHLVVFVAKFNNIFCGYVTLKWQSDYQYFKDNNIPEIVDLNVLPRFRKIGIGSKLIQACESITKECGHGEIGIGVGMTADYGNAQRLYVNLGYVPDGHGLYYKNKKLHYSDVITIDDDLVLYFTKNFNL